MHEFVNDDETLEDLGVDGLKLIQKKDGFRFGLDALALANSAKIKNSDVVCELGCGTAVISLIISKRNRYENIIALDIDEYYTNMAERSVALNKLSGNIKVINLDVKDAVSSLGHSSVDVIVCNPPYFGNSTIGGDSVARHETKASLGDWVKSAASLLKNRGRAYFVFTCTRISDVICEFNMNSLAVKKLQFIQHSHCKSPKIFLIEGVKNSNPGTQVLPTMILHNLDESKSTDWKKLYHE